jgi:hypothetical protein
VAFFVCRLAHTVMPSVIATKMRNSVMVRVRAVSPLDSAARIELIGAPPRRTSP